MESSSFSGSSKRAKAFGVNIPQIANCLVDGCNADLSLCRDYHRRHKVCEMHSKTARVTIGGRDQRFCQQCSRFHSLVEFDEGKRSCRKRLDGHNRRRRKSQPDLIPRNNPGLVFSAQTTGLLSFSTQQILSSPVNNSSWSSVIKSENGLTTLHNNNQQFNRQNEFPECSTQSYMRANQLQLIQGSGNSTVLCSKMYNEKLNDVVDFGDRAALSLLSSAPQQMVQRKELDNSESLGRNLQFGGGLGHYPFAQEDKVVVSSMDARISDVATLQFAEMFQHRHEGSFASESHQTHTFMWE